MTIPLREQLKNDAFDELNGAIDNSQTTITVADGSVFPAVGNFRILVGTEIMLVTARSSNTLTVVRAQEGTAASSASDGVPVTMVLTAGGLSRLAKDNDAIWGFSSAPAIGRIANDAGTGLLAVSDFTWVNQGSATATDQNGTIILRAPAAAGENMRALVRTAPSPPYVYIAAMQAVAFREGIPNYGIGFRQNSSGKMMVLQIVCDSSNPKRVAVYRFASATALSVSPGGTALAPLSFTHIGKYVWFRIEDDNTNLKFSISCDGIDFIQVLSESRTNLMLTTGPDEVLFNINNQGSTSNEFLGRLVHWSRVS